MIGQKGVCGTVALGGEWVAASAKAEVSFSSPAGGDWATGRNEEGPCGGGGLRDLFAVSMLSWGLFLLAEEGFLFLFGLGGLGGLFLLGFGLFLFGGLFFLGLLGLGGARGLFGSHGEGGANDDGR